MQHSCNSTTVRFTLALAAGLSLAAFMAPAAHAQLYANDTASIKTGDLMDRDYWRAKWDSMRLDEAIKERQPEGAILMSVISQINLLNDLLKQYPNDEDFKAWKKHAEEIQGKISSDANRGDSFKPGSLWNEWNYKEAFVNLNYARTAIDKKDWREAKDGLNSADRNLGFLRDRVKNNDRVSAWPDGAAAWVQQASADVTKMNGEVSAKLK